ncbi:CNT family concentrative nucleoside transporter [Lipingzhangella halophila]|uniref:CNT family concentrative nucleoside transporter n=1 Tax=Lipingzhangella halophila TaxID=1783352 RepID=A0A7W7RNY6_9ACTN|nr:NupC/NupG family nucleoside CNT transporter [Lipingzhangella halophila]MBB4935508.1 CNT family concentrative nucleoside transporter [Lipingzhangella halophila]
MSVLWGLGGMLVLLAIAFVFSTNRRAIKPRTVIAALALQFGFGALVLYWPVGQQALEGAAFAVTAVINSSNAGIDFLFGPILPDNGAAFAFQVLPIIIFVASVTAVLYYLHILQWVVRIIGGGVQKALGTSRSESLNATANIFVGQTEAPLVIRPYLPSMTRSEFFAVMVGGLSTVAGTVLVGYAQLGARMEFLIAASFMAAPGALLMAKIIIPETEEPVMEPVEGKSDDDSGRASAEPPPESRESTGEGGDEPPKDSSGMGVRLASGSSSAVGEQGPRNVIEAAARGASDGLKLAVNVGAMLLAFISLIALLNMMLGGVAGWFGAPNLTFEQILGYVFSPVMFVIGVPWEEAVAAGGFLGQKLILNEFVAFASFAPEAEQFSQRTITITTFALTGFANFSSLGILLGGLGSLVPSRRSEIAELGLRAILAGTLANLMSAAIAGILVT